MSKRGTGASPAIPLKKKPLRYYLKRDAMIYLIMLPGILYFIIFHYLPMFGIYMAFTDYKPGMNFTQLFQAEFVGLKWFKRFFGSIYAPRLIRNTFIISFLDLIFCWPAPIGLALLLNEVRSNKFKRIVQTISYLPHFLSSVIVVGMLRQLLSVDGGLINTILNRLGLETVYFLGSTRFYRTIYTASSWWSGIGWGSIIYLAAMSNIDPNLYEAADMDGATVFQKMRYITLPSIMSVIAIMLIMRVGSLMSVGYEKTLLLYSSLIYDVADIISTYVYREGLLSQKYSYSSAVGLSISLISLVLVVGSNFAAKKMGQEGLF